ncbi:hypothetical protein J6590_066459 [Homalodisca vitripennis]|nr:hypothetical protein J6590_066459 [Homalodisca vitripennis]
MDVICIVPIETPHLCFQCLSRVRLAHIFAIEEKAANSTTPTNPATHLIQEQFFSVNQHHPYRSDSDNSTLSPSCPTTGTERNVKRSCCLDRCPLSGPVLVSGPSAQPLVMVPKSLAIDPQKSQTEQTCNSKDNPFQFLTIIHVALILQTLPRSLPPFTRPKPLTHASCRRTRSLTHSNKEASRRPYVDLAASW